MPNTYIETFLPITNTKDGSSSPSVVELTIPVLTTGGKTEKRKVIGIVDNDITFSLQNKFGPILPDFADLQEIFTLMGSQSMPSWIGASSQVWKGTNPIALSFDMYVINWSPDCNSEDNLSALAQLCSVSPKDSLDKSKGPSEWTVAVHGGYVANILSGNASYWTSGSGVSVSNEGSKDGSYYGKNVKDEATGRTITPNELISNRLLEDIAGNSAPEGTISLTIGGKNKLSSLILTQCNITPSIVQVYDPKKSVAPRPLYYRVGLSLQTCRTALCTDVPGLFGLSS